MPNDKTGTCLVSLLCEVVFLITAVVFHAIFAIIALLPEAIFEGSALQKWKKTASTFPCCHQACPCHSVAPNFCQTCLGQTRHGTSTPRYSWRNSWGRRRARACQPRTTQSHRPPAGRALRQPCSTRQQSPVLCQSLTPQSLRARLEQHLLEDMDNKLILTLINIEKMRINDFYFGLHSLLAIIQGFQLDCLQFR